MISRVISFIIQSMKQTKILLLLTVMVAALLLPNGSIKASAPSAYDLIAAVNDLRANNGLSAISTDGILMSAAQTQSDYLANTCNLSSCNGHVGAGGTYAKDRAVAAGYDLQPGMNVIEAWAGRNANVGISEVIYDTWSDADHMAVMLHPDAIGVGAGITESEDGYIYYVLNVAVNYGSGGSGASVSSTPYPLRRSPLRWLWCRWQRRRQMAPLCIRSATDRPCGILPRLTTSRLTRLKI